MINRNISTKIFSVRYRYVSQVIVPCYYCVPDQHFSAMGNCEESAGRKKDCPFFQIKVEQFNIYIYIRYINLNMTIYVCHVNMISLPPLCMYI